MTNMEATIDAIISDIFVVIFFKIFKCKTFKLRIVHVFYQKEAIK